MICTRALLAVALACLPSAILAEAKPAARDKPVARKQAGRSETCVTCHMQVTPGIVEQWRSSRHAARAAGCVECHEAQKGDADAFEHYGALIATVVTPRDCARCHRQEDQEFERSHHARAGNILASLDNYLAEIAEGARAPFDPHSPTPGKSASGKVNGLASVQQGCQQCHGGKVALRAKDGGAITVDDLKPGPDGKPTATEAVERIARDGDGRPVLVPGTWPNTGIGRINLDGSLGSCAACHSRHDFSARRARQPEGCGKCHLGPDHPQKEVYEESKHGIAYRDLREKMNLDSRSWVLGKDYSQAPTCASCHVSANVNGGKVTHDIGERISWTNRPPVSAVMDTDASRKVVTEADPEKRKALVVDTWQQKRERMKQACTVCHTATYVDAFYQGYDDFVVLYNEKFAKPGRQIMQKLYEQGLLTRKEFDEEIEWTWYLLWHHEGRRARHGASMMAPDYAHWHGMFEVAEDFYMKLIPQAREIAARAAARGEKAKGDAVNGVIDAILRRPEHAWYQKDSQQSTQPAQQTTGK
jgi:hydroxylamine dehydrogenase